MKEDPDTIFGKIIRREVPATIVYEDDLCIAFNDIHPAAPVHILLIPKQTNGLIQLSNAKEHNKPILGHLMYTASVIAEQQGLNKAGWRLVVNGSKAGGQSVYHMHYHILGGRDFAWPPG